MKDGKGNCYERKHSTNMFMTLDGGILSDPNNSDNKDTASGKQFWLIGIIIPNVILAEKVTNHIILVCG